MIGGSRANAGFKGVKTGIIGFIYSWCRVYRV